MELSGSLDDLEGYWKEYLGRVERVWFKSYAHFKKSPKWNAWQDVYEKQRRTDPLIAYLRNARGADEHTVADIVEHQQGNIAIVPGEGGGGTIRNLRITDGLVTAETTGSVKVVFNPSRIRLLPVTNRGVTYPVPTSHNGAPIDPENVIAVAKAGLAFYDKFLTDAEKFFVDKK